MSSEPSFIPFTPPVNNRVLSLFWKALVLVVLTTVISTIAIGLYFRYIFRDTYNTFLNEQVRSYIHLVVDRVGTPPDIEQVERLTGQYPIDIRIEHGEQLWLTDSTIAPSSDLIQVQAAIPGGSDSTFRFVAYDNRFYGVISNNDWNYVIRLRSFPEQDSLLPATLILAAVLLLVFIGAYVSVKQFLKPVDELMQGVTEIGSGNFKYRVPVCSNDELGELTTAFNAMSQQVEAIIASKRRLLFDVSHELRSPLARMNIAIAMLPDGKAKNSIERNAKELNTMITELLENERLAVLGGALVVEQFDLVELAENIVETFGDDTDRLEFDSLTGNLPLKADNQRLTVALRNVISNALKYSAESEKPVKVTVFPDDDGARIIVQDHGIGISKDAQEKVFEPFYRTDDSRSRATGGYGLGLSLTKSIIEAHGGTIQLQSEPGEGTIITIWLPAVPAQGKVKPQMSAMQQAS